MADTHDAVTFTYHTADEVPALLDELCSAYADAYGEVPGEDAGAKVTAFRDRATKALEAGNYSLVTARANGELAGFVFGYSLRPDRGWWDGLTPEPPDGFTSETGSRTVVLAEIEVRKAWQGKGLGHRLNDAFLSGRAEERATLATGPKADAARALYERWGWRRAGTVPGKPGAYFSEYVLYYLPLPIGER
jgi:ribosomal protein S18 acetylase RimI-like enzyme